MALTEQRIIKTITVKPESQTIEVQWADQILRDGQVCSEQYHRKAYASTERAAFEAEVEGAAGYAAAAGWMV